MNVSLTPELERLVLEKVESGLFNSASEVIRAGLRLLAEQDEFRKAHLESLRSELKAGLDQEASGETVAGATVFRKLRDKNGRKSES